MKEIMTKFALEVAAEAKRIYESDRQSKAKEDLMQFAIIKLLNKYGLKD